MPPPRTDVQLAYQVCPIILTGGIAGQMQGAMLPILSLMYPGGSVLNLPFDINDLDDAFGAFNVLAGGTLISQAIGKYPMANQWVAANAVINEPLQISVIMDSPMRGANPWWIKKMVFSSLQATLTQHNNIGGMYTVVTPAFNYDNLVMLSLTDNSRPNSTLPQNAWRFDFEKPLLTTQDAQGALNAMMSKVQNQLPTNGRVSGPSPGETQAQPSVTATVPVTGYTIGGQPRTLSTVPSQNVSNFPALPPFAGLDFSGIS